MAAGPPSAYRYTAYDPFAWLYSRGWADDYHRQALGAIQKLLLAGLPGGARLLDVCCGSGNLARSLSERGYPVTGLDSSGPMLAQARRMASAAAFVLADARQFHFPAVFDGAVSTFDSLNHILALEELERVFRNVAGALRPGGVWVFDLNMQGSFQALWTGTTAEVEDDSAYVLRMAYDPAVRLARAQITMFRLRGQWERSDTTILERCYTPEEVRGALEAAGFVDIDLQEARNLAMHGHLAVGRTFFRARKP